MLLVIDNYDSFTYNIVHVSGRMPVKMEVVRNNQTSINQIRDLNPERLHVSPGPCSPPNARARFVEMTLSESGFELTRS